MSVKNVYLFVRHKKKKFTGFTFGLGCTKDAKNLHFVDI
jgi:hypothetical protein